MKQMYSLAHLTVLNCAPPEMIYIAAMVGYDFVSLRLIPLGTPGERRYLLSEDKEMLRQTRTALAATGIKVHDVELARIVDGVDPKSYRPAFEVAADLGARHILSSIWSTDRSYVIDAFSELCDLAKSLGLTVNLEFVPIAAVWNLAGSIDILRAVNRDNAGVMVDTMHFTYSRVKLEELDQVPREWFRFAHLCDAPGEIPAAKQDLVSVIREGRLYVGEGGVDVAGILNRIPQIPYSIELPNQARVQEFGYAEHARRCLQSAKDYFAQHPRGSADIAA
jgi:sugar phosphate isomerase/epimerase